MCAWKTGNARTLRMSAAISGSVRGTGFGGGKMARFASFTVGWGILGLTGGVSIDPGSGAYWSAGCSAAGAADSGQNPLELSANDPLDPINPPPALDIGGSGYAECAVEEWIDFVLLDTDTTTGPGSHGVFHTPPRARLRVYERYVAGSTATAHISCGGVTKTVTTTIATASDVQYLVLVNGQAWTGSGKNDTKEAQDLSVVCDFNTLRAVGSESVSCAGGSASNLHGAEIHLNAPGGIYGGFTGTAGAIVAPPKAFSLSGILKSVDSAYPGSVDVRCPVNALDTTPYITESDGWGLSGTQKYSTGNVDVSVGTPGFSMTSLASQNHGTFEWQNLSATVTSAWCAANGETVTYTNTDDAGNVATFAFDDNQIYFHGYKFPGLSLSQAATLAVDDCTSATGWANATHGAGGLHNTAAGPMVRTWADGFDFSGYRYLELTGCSASTAGTVTLSLGGKTFTAPVTTSASTVVFDLCDPATGGASEDTLDSKWPFDDYTTQRDISQGPLRGVSTAGTLSLGVASGTLTVGGVRQARHTGSTAHLLSEHAPRSGQDTPAESPTRPSGTDGEGSATTYAHRGLIALTDGRPSLEYADAAAQHVTTPSGEGDHWDAYYWAVSDLAARVNNGGPVPTIPPLPSGSMGWTATALAHADDASGLLNYGFLNKDCPASACWLCYGWHYLGGDSGWVHSLGLDASGEGLSLGNQVIFTELDWYPGCGDVFGLAPSGADLSGGGIFLGASKIYRSQALPVIIIGGGGDPSGKTINVTPGAGELQTAGTVVGSGTTDAQGGCRTAGTGLIGYTAGSASEIIVTDVSDG